MKPFFYSLLLLSLAAGCHQLTTGRQRDISAAEEARLLAKAVPPQEAGVQLTKRQDRVVVRWREMAYPETPVDIPMELADTAHSSQPIVLARLNSGAPIRMVVDTGAPVSLIDVSTALANHVQVIEPEQMRNSYRGLAGLEDTYFGMVRQLTVGKNLSFRTVLTAIRISRYERRLAGIVPVASWDGNSLGMSTLGNFAYLTFDYPGRMLTLSHREYFPGPGGTVALKLPFTYEAAQIRIPIQLGGRDCSALVDTGNDAVLMVNSNLVAELGWQKLADQGKREIYVGLGGDMHLRSFTIPGLRLGDKTFADLTATSGPEEFGVVLGSGFFQRYRLTLDFRRKTLWLEEP